MEMLSVKYFYALLFFDRLYQMLWVFKVKLYGQKFDEQLQRLTPMTERYFYYALLTWLNWQVEVITFDTKGRWWIYCLTLPPVANLFCKHHWFRDSTAWLRQSAKTNSDWCDLSSESSKLS